MVNLLEGGEDELETDPLFKVKGVAEDLPNSEKLRIKNAASQKLHDYETTLGSIKIIIVALLTAIAAYAAYKAVHSANPATAFVSYIVDNLISPGSLIGGAIATSFIGLVTGYANLVAKYKNIAQDPPDFNYKNKNPQVNLMGSNPTPGVQLVESYFC